MATPTKAEIIDYVSNEANRCPFCYKQNITITIPVNESVYRTGPITAETPMECRDCGKTWIELYKVVGIRFLEPQSEEITIKISTCDLYGGGAK